MLISSNSLLPTEISFRLCSYSCQNFLILSYASKQYEKLNVALKQCREKL